MERERGEGRKGRGEIRVEGQTERVEREGVKKGDGEREGAVREGAVRGRERCRPDQTDITASLMIVTCSSR